MSDVRPDSVPWLTPYVTVSNARASIAFYEASFGFQVHDEMSDDGMLMHVEMSYHGQRILMFAPQGAFGSSARAPKAAGVVSPQSFYLYVDDVDAVHDRAIAAGARSLMAPQDQFWGDRFAQVEDLDGYRWGLARPRSARA